MSKRCDRKRDAEEGDGPEHRRDGENTVLRGKGWKVGDEEMN
jgi:hypothetical protein